MVGTWQEAVPATVREFSATAYYFGRMIQQQLNIPVGLIVASWGGSACEALDASGLVEGISRSKDSPIGSRYQVKEPYPTVLYNGMLHPLIGLAMRGVIWYQGKITITGLLLMPICSVH